jgi:hypothetical protein
VPARLKVRCDDLDSRLREASMLAARSWKGGNSKNVGRQVARHHWHVEVRMFFCPMLPVYLYKLYPLGTPITGRLKDAALDVARARVNSTK